MVPGVGDVTVAGVAVGRRLVLAHPLTATTTTSAATQRRSTPRPDNNANWATKITADAELDMGGLKLPKGSYSIWTIPNPAEWTLIINSRTGQFHLDYDASTDFGRTKMNLKTLASPVEKFKIDLRSEGGNKGTLALDWDTTEASIPFTVSP